MNRPATRIWAITLILCGILSGCSDKEPEEESKAPPVRRSTAPDEPKMLTSRELRRKLKANDNAKFERSGTDIVEARLFQSGVKSIDALKGLPLRYLDLGMTTVSDLSPIEGMPLTTLILEDTPVSDLSPVKGMPLEVVYLQNTKITDLSVLDGMPIRELNLLAVPIKDLSMVAGLPLKTLWVPQTQVTDISALTGKRMVSLDIEGTEVSTLEPLTGMTSLKRLNIAHTKVSDLSPLKGMNLERITLTPENIKVGIELLREMTSLSKILTSMQGPGQSSAEFWKKYDDGVWAEKPSEVKDAKADEGNTKKEAVNNEIPKAPEPEIKAP